jgi:hypothetical protein
MCELSGEDIANLSKPLADALNLSSLQEFVHASTGDRLFVEYVTEGKPLRPTIIDLLNALQERGSSKQFLRYVYVKRPGKPNLRQLIATACPEAAVDVLPAERVLSVQQAGQVQAGAPTNALAPGLQRNVRPKLAKLDVQVWLERLIAIERRVCRIERQGAGLGTGFLVGPDTVLTNWHVVTGAIGEGKLAELGCRFDYVARADGAQNPGVLMALGADSCLTHSSFSAAETTATPEAPPPTPQELDFALLRLTSSAGTQVVAGVQRGWIALPNAALPLPEDAPLLIVQHPDGAPMKLAMDTQAVIGPNANGTRIKYRTNTDPGSSGSPCFSMDWDIVALHHYGDPNWQAPLFNQGVPIHLIRQRIEALGFGEALGP